MHWILVLAVAVVLCSTATWGQQGQSTSFVTSVGYGIPSPVFVAPGQVLTVFVRGVGSGLTEELRAERTPLPIALGGISVTIRQSLYPPESLAAPIFSVRAESGCLPIFAGDCKLAAITLQIPYELVPNSATSTGAVSNSAVLTIMDNGSESQPVGLMPILSVPHLVNTCDSVFPPSGVCVPAITHADGSLVTAANPARGGEVVVMYAFGLGRTETAVLSGAPTPAPTSPLTPVFIGFEFDPSAPTRWPPLSNDAIRYVGLVPGFVGLYQINFVIPEPPLDAPPCGDGVESNLTVSIRSDVSFDGGGVCVELRSQ